MRKEELKRKGIKMLIGLAVLTFKQRHVNSDTELGLLSLSQHYCLKLG